jgi:lysyl-tRNA synthetase class I
MAPDEPANARFVDAVRRDLSGAGTAIAVRLIWTADHLDAIRRLEVDLSVLAKTTNHGALTASPA